MDALSDVLQTLQLKGKDLCRLELGAPWGIDHPGTDIARFYVLERGTAWLALQGTLPPISLSAGDLVMFPHGTAHVIRDSPSSEDLPLQAIINRCDPRHPVHYLRMGGSGAGSVLLAGMFVFEHDIKHPVLNALPTVIHIPGEAGRAVPWLEATLHFLGDEATAQRPGMEVILSRLRDVMFVMIIRAWLEQNPDGHAGWLGALKDPIISKALGMMHRDLSQDWSVDSLARAVGQSRSVFAARFQDLVGEGPITYLSRWRIQVATRLLRSGGIPMKDVASRVGYATEAAFSKAFKRELGRPPGSWRREKAG